jgi:hypothetical protein
MVEVYMMLLLLLYVAGINAAAAVLCWNILCWNAAILCICELLQVISK